MKTPIYFRLGGFLAAFFLPLAAAVADSHPTVEVVGVQVVSKIYGDPEDFSNRISTLNAQNSGTMLGLFVVSPKGGILKVDGHDSKLSAFTDSKGNELMGVKEVKFSMEGIRSFNRISPDGKVASVELVGNGVPAKGSTHIAAKGEIAVTLAEEKKTFRSAAADLAAGSVFKAGEMEFTVKKVGKPDFGDAAMEVQLAFTGAVSAIAAYRFIDKNGKTHELKKAGYSAFGSGSKAKVKAQVQSEVNLTAGSLEIDLWLDLEEVKVPFDVKADVGLGE